MEASLGDGHSFVPSPFCSALSLDVFRSQAKRETALGRPVAASTSRKQAGVRLPDELPVSAGSGKPWCVKLPCTSRRRVTIVI